MHDGRHTELLIATKNAGKVRELSELLGGLPLTLRDLSEFPEIETADETGATFEENAAIKARFYGHATGLLTLADDSGLEVDALGGAPGVHSARYAGESATDEERVSLLLREIGHAPNRAARFVCVAAIYDPPRDSLNLFRAECPGRIAAAPRGSNGFGYDPVFIPSGFTQTFGELADGVKQRISHRGLAVAAVRDFLEAGI
jgi:XTP/dITP diphosphohydrolase